MSEVKHTPGTWELAIARTMVHLHGAAGYFGISLPWKTEQDKANARLIAAAPELLVALEDAYAEICGLECDGPLALLKTQIESAIAKATGGQQ